MPDSRCWSQPAWTRRRSTSISARPGRRRHAAFALEPASLDLGGVLKASARVSLANVPRGVFSPNLAQATAMAAQIEAGPLELTLRDTGGIDLAVAQQARAQNISREPARRAIVDGIRSGREQAAGANPDAVAAVEAMPALSRPRANAERQAHATRQGAGSAARSSC